jgi:ATP-binding cassette subfamily F protein 1
MGVYQQHFVDRLPMDKSAVQHLRDRFQDQDYQSVRNRLGKYGLEGHAHEVNMRDLSGGQKARVVFVELSLQRPHVLLLGKIYVLTMLSFGRKSNFLLLSLV